MSRATFVVLLCSHLAWFNFLYSVCHDYGFESMGQGFDEALYLGLLGGSFMINYVRTYVVDLELGSTPFEGAEHVGVLAEMTFHEMTLIQVLNG